YSLSFMEPWLGGKKPIQFSGSISYSKQYDYDWSRREANRDRSFNIISVYFGLGKRLSVPDDYFYLQQGIGYQHYDLHNYNTNLFTFGDGAARNLSYTIGFSRNSKGHNPIFPTTGAEVGITGKFTFPYSLVNGVDYGNLGNLEEYKLTFSEGMATNPASVYIPREGDYVRAVIDETGKTYYEKVNDYRDASVDQGKVDQKKFAWLEYYKIKFKVDAYTQLRSKFVLRSAAEFGYLGAYNSERGLVPFERFFVGGDGLANFSLDGREIVQLRGYPNNALSATDAKYVNDGGT